MAHLSYGDESKIQLVIDTNIASVLVKHLFHSDDLTLVPCLRALGNFAEGVEHQTDVVLNIPGVTGIFLNLLNHNYMTVRKEALWVLSNIAAGTPKQIEVLLKCPGLVTKINSIISTDDSEVTREAAWVLANIAASGTPEQVRFLIDNQVMNILVNALDSEDNPKLLSLVLDCLKNILSRGLEGSEQSLKRPHLIQFEAPGGVEKLEILQDHSSDEVCKAAVSILESYFK